MWNRSQRIWKEQELDDEILAHLAIEVKRRMDAGETREEAERAARRDFGSVVLVKEITRSMWAYPWLESLLQDVKYGLRGMRKTPGFTAIAILTLGLGIGASTAVFSVVNGILLRPLPYPEPDRIVMLWRVPPAAAAIGGDEFPWGKFDFNLFREQAKAFTVLGAIQANSFNLTGRGDPVFLEGMRTTAGFFPAMGVAPALGRWYTAEEDRRGREHVVVLGHKLWQEHFGADPNVLGRAIQLNGFSYTVVGVMPPQFSFPHGEEMPAMLEFPREAQLWVPLAIAPGERGASDMAVVGRMRPEVTTSRAQAELDVFAGRFERLYPAAKEWSKSRAVPLAKQIVGDSRRPLLLLLGAVGLVLLIACSNVAGLVLTRSLARRREFRLRAALGAGYGRLIRQLLTETLLLSISGGILGVALAEAGVRFARAFGPADLPRLQEVSLDLPVLAFCVAITLVTGLLFGLGPGIGAGRDNLADALNAGRRMAGNHLSPALRNGLLIGQVALSLMLVVAAGLLARTFYGLTNADGGFNVEHVLTFEMSLPAAHYPDPDKMAQLYDRALQTLASLPGVESAGLVHAVPMGGQPDATMIRIPGRTFKPNEEPFANYMFASAGYFTTVRTPLLRGREFLPSDTLHSMPVTIINRAMAEAFWPGENALGKQVGVRTAIYPARTIVGVVANVKQSSLREQTAPQMYVPYTQNEIKTWPLMQTMQVALRTKADPAQMTASLRKAMHAVDPGLPVAKVAMLTALVDQSLTQPRFAMLLLVAFGTLSLLLACIGMYGVISFSVTRRTQEIGIRMALGAERANIFAMVMGQGARLAGAGIAIGFAGALVGTRSLASFLYGVRPADPLTFGAVLLLFVAVALLACYLPAKRATHVDPMIALRHD